MKLNTVILKAAAPCNLDCSYCYEYNRGDESWRSKPKRLGVNTAQKVGKRIAEYCQAHGIGEFHVNLHGGEPLLLGASGLRVMFDTLIAATPGVRLRLGVQTNATLISPEILDVLERYSVAVGVSIDGGRDHNRWRVGHGGAPAYDRIIKGLDLLRQRRRIFSGLQAVVDLSNNPEEVLDALSAFDPPAIDLLPPFGNHDNPPFGGPGRASLGDWLIRAFDYWMDSRELQAIRIRYLEDALVAVLCGESRSDWFGLRPPGYVVVATDGEFEGLDTLKVAGEVGRTTGLTVWSAKLDRVLQHDVMEMRMRGVAGLCGECQACPIVRWCGGGYLPTRFGRSRGFDNPSYFCDDMKQFFTHIGGWLSGRKEVEQTVAAEIRGRLAALADPGVVRIANEQAC
jgi:sulfatase maturation enzyme AslB (radical SAM superfamily)